MSPQRERGPLQADAKKLDSASPATPPVLEAVGLGRSFGPIEVLSDVSISVRAANAQAYIGQNPPGAFPPPRRTWVAGHILTLVGLNMYAIGANEEAAELAGVPSRFGERACWPLL